MGTRARNASKGAKVAGATSATGLTTGPNETSGTNAEEDGVESSRSDAKQQLSASAWLTTFVAPVAGGADVCIGQASLVQHAIRASGVASHPAQRPEPPTERLTIAAAAAMRLMSSSTGIG